MSLCPIIAAIQMCSSDDVDDNLKMAASLIETAANNGARLVVLPEMFALISNQSSAKIAIKEPLGDGKIQSFLSEQAKRNGVYLVGGTIPISANETKISAACLVYNDQGQRIAHYNKIHLFDVALPDKETHQESALIQPGNKLTVVDTPFGKIGLAICYDVRFPELFRSLFHRGAEIIILPSAFTMITGKAHWEVLTRARAIENFCYLVGACQGGDHASGRKTYGHSLIIEPWGNMVSQLANQETGIIYAELNLSKIQEARAAIPIKEHRKIFIDNTLF
jgi:predicted amidohydrolase